MYIKYPVDSIVYFQGHYEEITQGKIAYVRFSKDKISYYPQGWGGFSEDQLTSYLDEAVKKWFKQRGDWKFERINTIGGYRCQKCSTWICEDHMQICECDN